MIGYRAFRFPFELLVGLMVAMLAGSAVVAMSDIEMRYKLATVAAVAAFAVLAPFPERRVGCVILWVLIHPLGIERLFVIDAAEGPQFSDPVLSFNASDGPLVLLALFLVAETVSSNRVAFRWSPMMTPLLVLLVWSTVSLAIHATYLSDGFTTSAPLALLQDIRLLVFVLLVQSAIRSRGDVILILLAIGAAVLLQTVIVCLSYSTGRVFLYAATADPGGAATLQGFDTSGGSEVLRATGTFGQVNEQAIFHTVMTIPLIAFFVARNRFVRGASLVVSAGSALAVVLTFSRGAWLAFPIGLAACGIMALRRQMIHRTAVLGGAIVCTGIAVALLFLAKPIYQRLTFGDNGATAARLRMAVLATDLFEAYPIIGVGPGEFAEAALRLYPPGFSQNQWVEAGERQVSTSVGRVEFMELRSRGIVFFRRPLPVHNKYLLMLSELGLPGLLIWLWLYVEVIRVAWRCSKLPDRFLSLFGIAGLGVTAAELVYMMVEHFHDDKPLEPTLLIPAMMFATWRVASAEQRLSQPYGVAWRSVGQAASGR